MLLSCAVAFDRAAKLRLSHAFEPVTYMLSIVSIRDAAAVATVRRFSAQVSRFRKLSSSHSEDKTN